MAEGAAKTGSGAAESKGDASCCTEEQRKWCSVASYVLFALWLLFYFFVLPTILTLAYFSPCGQSVDLNLAGSVIFHIVLLILLCGAFEEMRKGRSNNNGFLALCLCVLWFGMILFLGFCFEIINNVGADDCARTDKLMGMSLYGWTMFSMYLNSIVCATPVVVGWLILILKCIVKCCVKQPEGA